MSKLYFKYGAMGSSKSAQALMCKFNYEQVGFTVALIKPIIDNRDIDNNEIIVKRNPKKYNDKLKTQFATSLKRTCRALTNNMVYKYIKPTI